MGPDERRAARDRWLALSARVVSYLSDGSVSVDEVFAAGDELQDILGAIRRDRQDADDTPDGAEV
jgi:hypothetical protein